MTTPVFSVAGQRVLVVGAARSGVAAALLLVGRGASVTLADRQPAIADAGALESAGVALELGRHRVASFTGADLIVLSPGVPIELPELTRAREAGVPVQRGRVGGSQMRMRMPACGATPQTAGA